MIFRNLDGTYPTDRLTMLQQLASEADLIARKEKIGIEAAIERVVTGLVNDLGYAAPSVIDALALRVSGIWLACNFVPAPLPLSTPAPLPLAA